MCDAPPEVINGYIVIDSPTYNAGEEAQYKCNHTYIAYESGNAINSTQEFIKLCAVDLDIFNAFLIVYYTCDGKSRIMHVMH